MFKRIIITAEDVRALEACSLSTAYERIKQAKAVLSKKRWQKLTIAEFCDYYDYDIEVVTFAINGGKKAS